MQVKAVDGRPSININSSCQLALIGRSVDFRLCKGKSQVSQLKPKFVQFVLRGIHLLIMLCLRATSRLSYPSALATTIGPESAQPEIACQHEAIFSVAQSRTCAHAANHQVASMCPSTDLSPGQVAVTAGQGCDCREPVDGSKTMYCKRHAAAMESQIAAMARPQLSEHHIASALRGFKPNSLCSGRPLHAYWMELWKRKALLPGRLWDVPDACMGDAALLAVGNLLLPASAAEPGLQPAAAPCCHTHVHAWLLMSGKCCCR